MVIKIAHHDDGKEKCQSHRCNLFNDSDEYHNFDLTDIYGYGETKEEAIENLKQELDYYFREIHALEKMLYETNVLDKDVVEVDCMGRKI